MSFELAIKLTQLLLGFAVVQQSLEHLSSPHNGRFLFAARAVLGVILMTGVGAQWAVWLLLGFSIVLLHRFAGPYNGGSDKMTVLILACLSLVHLAPNQFWKDMALSYLALQLALSYSVSGWVKIINPEWRSGTALSDVFLFSAYPVSGATRSLAERRDLLWLASWIVILFEVLFPLSMLHPLTLYFALGVAGLFHLSNAVLFGLNRFVWIWISAFPALIWFQSRVLSAFS